MKNSLLVLCALLLSLNLWGQERGDVASRFAEELARESSSINAIESRFEQVRVMQILADEVSRSGNFTYRRPDHISLDFVGGDYIRMTSTAFTMRVGGHEQQVRIQSNPMLRELKRILSACMMGDVESLQQGFTMTITEQPTQYWVTLTPRKGRMAARMAAIKMTFDKETMTLDELKMEERSGDYTAYRFFDKQITR